MMATGIFRLDFALGVSDHTTEMVSGRHRLLEQRPVYPLEAAGLLQDDRFHGLTPLSPR